MIYGFLLFIVGRLDCGILLTGISPLVEAYIYDGGRKVFVLPWDVGEGGGARNEYK